MEAISKQIQELLIQVPDLSLSQDNTKNILDLESGSIRLSISPQLNINIRDDTHSPHIPHEYSKNCTQSLIPQDLFYTNIDSVLQKKQKELAVLQKKSQFLPHTLIPHIQALSSDLAQPNPLIVNNRTINSRFNILSGAFESQKEGLINPRYKDYNIEDLDERNDPHLLTQKTKKTKEVQQSKDIEGICQELLDLQGTIKITQESGLETLNDDIFKKSQESVAKVLSMTNELISTGQFEFVQKKDTQPQNTLWDNLYGTIKKQDRKDELYKEIKEDHHKLQHLLDDMSEEEEIKEDQNSEKPMFNVIKLGQLKEQTKSALYATNYNYAVQDQTDLSTFYHYLPKENFAISYPFELDDFQKAAILHLEQKESVFVAAHTSAGKTVVAEYAVALSQKHKTRAVYTSPIKALSNQKYREFQHKFKDVGIITGDVTIKPEASCVIMTTEILRSMLYKGSDMVRDIEWVIFDEVHYVSNSERGVVWEETIIMLPEHIGIIMLSATVPNAMDFADWVNTLYCLLIYLVPLEHNIYVLSQFHVIKEADGPFMHNEYQFFLNNIDRMKEMEKMDISALKKQLKAEKKEAETWKDKARGQKRKQMVTNMMTKKGGKFIQGVTYDDFSDSKHKNEYVGIQKLIKHCQKEKMLPCTVFCFSKVKIMQLAQRCMTYDLCDKNESGKITVFFNRALKKLKPNDRELPQFIQLRAMLEKGYAMHHGDLLPLAKEIVEILYSEGLVKVLFATETFAMGVNMPAKTVIYFGLQKNDGVEFRYLKSSEYTQMSGRAGRRGLDEKGNVILYMKDATKLPDTVQLRTIIDSKGETLESKFRLTYAIILNLLTAKDIDVLEMMKRSFGENTRFSQLPRIKERIRFLKKESERLSKIECPYDSDPPIEAYYKCLENIEDLSQEIYTDQQFLNKAQLPKFALIQCVEDQLELGVILQSYKQKKDENTEVILFKVLLLSKIESKKKILIRYEKEQQKSEPTRQLNTDPNYGYRVVILKASEIHEIFSEKLNFNTQTDNIHNDHRLLQQVADEIKGRLENPKKKLQKLQVTSQTKVKGGDLGELMQNKEIQVLFINQLKSKVNSKCNNCELKMEHFTQIENRKNIAQEMKDLLKNTNEENLSLIDDFQARELILEKLNYIDSDKVPLIKARVARELSDNEIFLCEVLMENVLDKLEPDEIAAVLSGFICQWKTRAVTDNYADANQNIQDAMQHIEEIIEKIAFLEIEQHIFFDDVDTFIESKVNFNHVKVVYEWAKQRDFVEVCQMTESQEGTIVKTIQRLDILLKDVKNAAKVMGNMALCKKIEEASTLIKRDIVFVSSLYLE